MSAIFHFLHPKLLSIIVGYKNEIYDDYKHNQKPTLSSSKLRVFNMEQHASNKSTKDIIIVANFIEHPSKIMNSDGSWNYDYDFNLDHKRVSTIICGTDIILSTRLTGRYYNSRALDTIKYAATHDRHTIISCNEVCKFTPRCKGNNIVYVLSCSSILHAKRVYVCKKCYENIKNVKITRIPHYIDKKEVIKTIAEYNNDICCYYGNTMTLYRKYVLPLNLHWYPAIKLSKELKIPESPFVIQTIVFRHLLTLSKIVFIQASLEKYWIISQYIIGNLMPDEIYLYIGGMMCCC